MADLTNAELTTQVNLLNQRMVKLPTAASITTLRTLLDEYKTTTDALLDALTLRVAANEARLNDHETRLQALEP